MMTTHVLAPRAPFDFGHTLAFVRGFAPMRGEQVVSGGPLDGQLTKALSVDGRPVAVNVRSTGDREHPVLEVRLSADQPLPEPSRQAALARVAAYLGLDDDLARFYAAAAGDPSFAPLTVRYRGLHHVRFPSAFEAACWAVINQRTSLALAGRLKEALVRRAGGRVRVDGDEYWCFPEPAAVARLEEDDLARLVPGGRRARALAALARAFLALDPRFLREAPIETVRDWLRDIEGVGPFTSGFVLYRGLGRFDGATLVSPRLVAAAAAQYCRPLDAADIVRLAQGYGEWGGYWMLYLWASTFVPPGRDGAADSPSECS